MTAIGRYAGVAIAAGMVAAAGLVSAQTPQTSQNPQGPTFKSTTSLVLVDVTVLDKDGRPVPGLTAEDFKVKLNGDERSVKVVNYQQIAAPPDATPDVPNAAIDPTDPASVTAAVSPRRSTTQRRVIVVMVDDLSMTPDRGRGMLSAAERFVMSLPSTDLVGYATSSSSGALSPTTDHLAVASALRHVVGELSDPRQILGPPVGIEEAIQIADGNTAVLNNVVQRDCAQNANANQNLTSANALQQACSDDVERKGLQEGRVAEGNAQRQIRAFLAAVSALSPVPGLKHIVLISDGLALVQRTQSAAGLEPLARVAAAAGVQVNVLSEEPDRGNLGITDTSHAASLSSGFSAQVIAELKRSDDIGLGQGIETVADLTGGQYYRVIGTPEPFFNRIALATSALYELGVDAPDKVPGKDYTLSVSVARPGFTAHANHHALVPEPAKPVPVENQLTDAIANGTPLYGIPMSVGASMKRGLDPGQVNVNLDIDVPSSIPGPLQMMFGLADDSNVVRSGKKAIDPPPGGGDYRVQLAVPVATGNYRVRLAVADANGEVGSLETRVRAVLRPMGPFEASDLMTAWASNTGQAQFIALGQLPPSATHLIGQLELYPSAGAVIPADLKVHVTITTPDNTPVEVRDVTPVNQNGVLRAQAPFDLAHIPAGAYVLKAVVSAGGATLGTVSTVVRTTRASVLAFEGERR